MLIKITVASSFEIIISQAHWIIDKSPAHQLYIEGSWNKPLVFCITWDANCIRADVLWNFSNLLWKLHACYGNFPEISLKICHNFCAELPKFGWILTNFSEILIEIQTFHWGKYVWKFCLRNVGHLFSASMCYTVFLFIEWLIIMNLYCITFCLVWSILLMNIRVILILISDMIQKLHVSHTQSVNRF